ncbi:MAG TPA: TonB-dependent receptor [Daejeonella sp.]|nr:TonB-dependent receptor [Daejeonella sp.]
MKRKNLYVGVGLGLAQLALLTGNAWAQTQPVRNLDEVVVTASRSSKKQSEIGKVVRVIPAETLAKSQGRTLTEVLNNVAGLTIGGNGNNPGDVQAVYLRGSSASNTLILIDGVPVNDVSGITAQYDISAIPVDQVERIEILKGGNSTLYGSDAVAGVINIITKKGYGKLAGNLMATAGNYDTYKQALGLNGQIQQTAIALNISNTNSKGFSTAKPANGETDFDKDGYDQRSLSFNLSQQFTDKFLLKANVQADNRHADMDAGAFADAKGHNYTKTALLAGLGGTLSLSKGSANFNLSQNNVKNLFNQDGQTNNIGKITHAEADLNYALTNFLDLTSGLSYKYTETDQANPYSAPLSAHNNRGSVFTSLFFKTQSGFYTEIGGRYNNHSQYGSNFTYTVNPSYVIDGRYKIFVNVSSAFREPSLYQLYSEYGNINLKPESSTTYETGFDLDLLPQILNLSFSYFQRDIKDVIDFGPVAPGKFGYINQNKQKDKGFEIEASAKPADAVTLNAFYSYVDGKQTTPFATEFNLFRRPKNTVGANAGFALGKAVNLNLIYKFTGSRLDRYFEETTFEMVEANLKSYHMLDAYVQYQPGSKWTLFADVKNLLDKNYTEFAGYTTKGINLNAGVRLEIR